MLSTPPPSAPGRVARALGFALPALLFLLLLPVGASAQTAADQVTINVTGSKKHRIAVPDFQVLTPAPALTPLQQTFDDVLWNDLHQSGVVEMVSKSVYPLQTPGKPADLNQASLLGWANPPANAQDLAFGNISVVNGVLLVEGYLYDTTKPAQPFLLGKRYTDQPTQAAARAIAHQFAEAIIELLGGGPGLTGSKIAFISNRTGHKEVWLMDYDGANQQQITHLGSICYSPRLSPDGTRIAFMTYGHSGTEIRIYSLISHRYLYFPTFAGMNTTPAWSPDGSHLAFSSSMAGDGNSQIYTIRADGGGLHRLTYAAGVNTSPVWNPKTGSQIAFVSDRTGLPQIYVMDADGTNQQRVTNSGYAVSPSWSPNGLLLAFSWVRRGGGENGGAFDIYLYDLVQQDPSQKWVQLTHNGERNDDPSWGPDGRHVVYQSGSSKRTQLFSVLADGSSPAQLTTEGSNEMPNWSFH